MKLGLVAYGDGVAERADTLEESGKLNVDDLEDGVAFKGVEDYHVVDTVEEFGREGLVESLGEYAVRIFAVDFTGIESDSAAEFLQLTGADIRGHDYYCVLEVDAASEAVGESAFVHNLKQEIEYVGVRFLDFVEKYDRVGVTAHTLGQAAAFLISDVSGRRSR